MKSKKNKTYIFRHKKTGETVIVKGPDKDFPEAYFQNCINSLKNFKDIGDFKNDPIRGHWDLISNTGTLTNKDDK